VLMGDSVAVEHERMRDLSLAKLIMDEDHIEYLEDREHPRERDERTKQIDLEEPERDRDIEPNL
jgi:hypothetical protein